MPLFCWVKKTSSPVVRIYEDKLYETVSNGTAPQSNICVHIFADRVNKNEEFWPAIPIVTKELKLFESITQRVLIDLRKAGLKETQQQYPENEGYSSHHLFQKGLLFLSF